MATGFAGAGEALRVGTRPVRNGAGLAGQLTRSSSPLAAYLESLILAESGGVYFPLDDTGATARAINPAVALGRNIVVNGDFSSDTVWTKGTGWTIAGGVAHNDGTGSTALLAQVITGLIGGKTYEVTFTISNYVSGSVRAGVGTAVSGQTRSANGTYTENIVANANGSIFIQCFPTTFVGDIDNVSVRQVNIPASTSFTGAELLADGDMEAATTAAWTAQFSAILSKQTTNPHGGSRVLRVARNGTNNPYATQNVLTAGKTYRVQGYTRSDGFATARVGTDFVNFFASTTSTSWQAFDFLMRVDNAGALFRLQAVTSTGTEYVEFDDVSVTEVNPLTGSISGATVNQDAGSKLLKAYSFDGVNDYVDIYSADLNSVFDPTAGTLLVFAKVDAVGVWTDGVDHRLVNLRFDASNRVELWKRVTNNTLDFTYVAGGTAEQIQVTTIGGSVDWFVVAMTWDKAADQVKAYVNGAQVGTTQTGLGTWAGNLASTTVVLGALSTSGTNPWSGFLAHVALFNRALSASELLTIAQRAGVA